MIAERELEATNSGPIPRVSWEAHQDYVVAHWDYEHNPHVTVISPTGGGKTSLLRCGLLPMLANDQVMVIDSKGWDKEINGAGLRRVRRFPPRWERNALDRGEFGKHYQYVARDRAGTFQVINRCYSEGKWVLIIDELRRVCDRNPNLGLASTMELVITNSRGRLILISMTQAPRWIPSTFIEQPSHLYVGHLEGKYARAKLADTGTDPEIVDRALKSLVKYEWLYIGLLQNDGRRHMEIVMCPYFPPTTTRR